MAAANGALIQVSVTPLTATQPSHNYLRIRPRTEVGPYPQLITARGVTQRRPQANAKDIIERAHQRASGADNGMP